MTDYTTDRIKRTVQFVLYGKRADVTLDIDPELNPGPPHVSLTGTYDGGGGQIDGRLAHDAESVPEIQTLCELWTAHHLQPPTDENVAAIMAALDALEGERFGAAPDVDDAPDVSETDDVIDSRDVINRLECYREALTAAGIDPDETTAENFNPDSRDDGETIREYLEEYHALKALEDEASGYAADWRYGETLIRDSYFEDYAQELADDIGATDRDSKWPNNHIDWKAAAAELQQDYTAVEFKGVTYWTR